ncbi:Transcriptional regulator PadR-like family protein [Nonomuraea solani]|uniref:Transcriptional regulator PadR-like family protein n=1 Tax=Nonomuraea solani TaxID=1144553 RepID=A0A1H6EV29_9ACTN|nr:helix-turn-helix transcriptional regulator [Nonomuraea solani]SEH01233.1 Transcriptional regulator PadR-like family protein [Nonomuraea solani]
MQPLPTITPATVDVIEALMADLNARWDLEIVKASGRAPGSVYLVLDRLERSGWVTSAWEADSVREGPRRRLYRLTGDALPAARRAVAAHAAAAHQPIGQSLPQPGVVGEGLPQPGV